MAPPEAAGEMKENTHLSLSPRGGARANRPLDFELRRRHHFHLRVESHHEVSSVAWRGATVVRKALEHAPEALLEHGLSEGICEDYETPGLLRTGPHLQHSNLIQVAREDIDDLRMFDRGVRKVLVVLHSLRSGALVVRVGGLRNRRFSSLPSKHKNQPRSSGSC